MNNSFYKSDAFCMKIILYYCNNVEKADIEISEYLNIDKENYKLKLECIKKVLNFRFPDIPGYTDKQNYEEILTLLIYNL